MSKYTYDGLSSSNKQGRISRFLFGEYPKGAADVLPSDDSTEHVAPPEREKVKFYGDHIYGTVEVYKDEAEAEYQKYLKEVVEANETIISKGKSRVDITYVYIKEGNIVEATVPLIVGCLLCNTYKFNDWGEIHYAIRSVDPYARYGLTTEQAIGEFASAVRESKDGIFSTFIDANSETYKNLSKVDVIAINVNVVEIGIPLEEGDLEIFKGGVIVAAGETEYRIR